MNFTPVPNATTAKLAQSSEPYGRRTLSAALPQPVQARMSRPWTLSESSKVREQQIEPFTRALPTIDEHVPANCELDLNRVGMVNPSLQEACSGSASGHGYSLSIRTDLPSDSTRRTCSRVIRRGLTTPHEWEIICTSRMTFLQ